MREPGCAEVIRRLALGEPTERDGLASHLSRCADCRRESLALQPLLQELAADAQLDPPAELDARIRRLLLDAPPLPLLFGRPVVAAALAIAAFLAVVGSVAEILAQAGAAEQGLWIALTLGSVYLALSAAAVLPLLFVRRPISTHASEVQA